ncbi:DNA polymerase family B-domain-containing protein [Gongronella butleri]|nr:DNA polymerase family B-domain-containing protein [Gongronella butleri]
MSDQGCGDKREATPMDESQGSRTKKKKQFSFARNLSFKPSAAVPSFLQGWEPGKVPDKALGRPLRASAAPVSPQSAAAPANVISIASSPATSPETYHTPPAENVAASPQPNTPARPSASSPTYAPATQSPSYVPVSPPRMAAKSPLRASTRSPVTEPVPFAWQFDFEPRSSSSNAKNAKNARNRHGSLTYGPDPTNITPTQSVSSPRSVPSSCSAPQVRSPSPLLRQQPLSQPSTADWPLIISSQASTAAQTNNTSTTPPLPPSPVQTSTSSFMPTNATSQQTQNESPAPPSPAADAQAPPESPDSNAASPHSIDSLLDSMLHDPIPPPRAPSVENARPEPSSSQPDGQKASSPIVTPTLPMPVASISTIHAPWDPPLSSLASTQQDTESWLDHATYMLQQLSEKSSVTPAPASFDTLDGIECDTRGYVPFWWMDAQQFEAHGYVYLFGKVYNASEDAYHSCCVLVKNIKRTIYVLPRDSKYKDTSFTPTQNSQVTQTTQRESVSKEQVMTEFRDVLLQCNVSNYTCTVERKKYAFDLPDVPREADYLKYQYSYADPAPPSDLNGETYSHVFGTTTMPLEHLLVQRGIKGPQWLYLQEPRVLVDQQDVRSSWCHYELEIDDMNRVHALPTDDHATQPLPTPPLCIMSIHLLTSLDIDAKVNNIVAASIFVQPKVNIDQADQVAEQENARIALVCLQNKGLWPNNMQAHLTKAEDAGLKIHAVFNEYILLSLLCTYIQRFDPDILVGHDFTGFTLDVLLRRMRDLRVAWWHKIGRLQWADMPHLQYGPGGTGYSSAKERRVLAGRLVCDSRSACMDLIKAKAYDLPALALSELHIDYADVSSKEIKQRFASGANGIIELAQHCWVGAYATMALVYKVQVLPLTKRLTNLAGNLWSSSLVGSRTNQNEYLLLHEFHRLGYLCPDRVQKNWNTVKFNELDDDDNKMGNAIVLSATKQVESTGGLVLEPRTGFYDQFVVLLDFNSLYPSIIQEFNICFTTVHRPVYTNVDGDIEHHVPDVPDADLPTGVLPTLVKRFVDERHAIKREMKQSGIERSRLKQFDIQQQALKIMANSVYGCLGSSISRFFARPLALLITSIGRRTLQDTVLVAKDLGLDVIYGDTDSVMIATYKDDVKEAMAIGERMQRVINEQYRLLEMGIDGYFKHLLILTKKKYASLTVMQREDQWVSRIETKGVDLVRRDWCSLSRDTSMAVLKVILSAHEDKKVAIESILSNVNQNVRENSLPIRDFVIFKQVTKPLHEYDTGHTLPHVRVAIKMREYGKIIKQGDVIGYVISKSDKEHANVADRAVMPGAIEQGLAKLDLDWYLESQVLPPVARLCEQLMDTSMFPGLLGVSASTKTKRRAKLGLVRRSSDNAEFTRLERPATEPWMVHCRGCHHAFEMPAFAVERAPGRFAYGFQCPRPQCLHVLNIGSIVVQLRLALRHYIQRYYNTTWICNNADCDYESAHFTAHCANPNGCTGIMLRSYTEENLYSQLVHFESLFDVQEQGGTDADKQLILRQYGDVFTLLLAIVREQKQWCAYQFIDLSICQ